MEIRKRRRKEKKREKKCIKRERWSKREFVSTLEMCITNVKRDVKGFPDKKET